MSLFFRSNVLFVFLYALIGAGPANCKQCQSTLQSIFLRGAPSEGEGLESPLIDMLCDAHFHIRREDKPKHNLKPHSYCCDHSQFKSLVDQFYLLKFRLKLLQAKVFRLFRFVRDISDADFARLHSAPDPQTKERCQALLSFPNLAGQRRQLIRQAMRYFSQYIDWKIGQISALPCFACSPHQSERFRTSGRRLSLVLANATCSDNMDALAKADSAVYNLVYFGTIARFMRCVRGAPDLPQLANLVDNKTLELGKKNRSFCSSRSQNHFKDKRCVQLVRDGSHPAYFPYYRQFKVLSEVVWEEFRAFLGPVDLRAPEEAEQAALDDEAEVLGLENLHEQVKVDFQGFTNFSGANGRKMYFDVECEYAGGIYANFALNQPNLDKFEVAISKQEELDLRRFQNLQDHWGARQTGGQASEPRQDALKEVDVHAIKSLVMRDSRRPTYMRHVRKERLGEDFHEDIREEGLGRLAVSVGLGLALIWLK